MNRVKCIQDASVYRHSPLFDYRKVISHFFGTNTSSRQPGFRETLSRREKNDSTYDKFIGLANAGAQHPQLRAVCVPDLLAAVRFPFLQNNQGYSTKNSYGRQD